jgi:hypothetical protein
VKFGAVTTSLYEPCLNDDNENSPSELALSRARLLCIVACHSDFGTTNDRMIRSKTVPRIVPRYVWAVAEPKQANNKQRGTRRRLVDFKA